MTQGGGGVTTDLDRITYSVADSYYGPYSITYTIQNGVYAGIVGLNPTTSTTTLSGTVVNVPDKPIANPDEGVTSEENGSVDILEVVGKDWDVDNWPVGQIMSYGLTVASVTATGGEAVKINGDTGINFTPTPNLNSSDPQNCFSVTYYVKDPQGNVSENSVTIPITVTPINVKPKGKGGDSTRR